MTLINQIRDKSWLLLVVIGIAMLAFILGDLFSNNSALLGGDQPIVGEINGNEVNIQEFNNIYEEERNAYVMQTGQTPQDFVLQSLRQRAWGKLMQQLAYSEQYEKLGIQVSEEELVDMVQGNNIDPGLAQSFTNQETGEVDRAAIRNYLAQLGQLSPQDQAVYYKYERDLIEKRKKDKYDNLVARTYFATSAEAKREYEKQNATASVQYLYVPYSAVADSVVNASEADVKQYFNQNKDKYKSEANRGIEYIFFPISPSAEDEAEIEEEVRSLVSRFETTKDDSAFVMANSEAINNTFLLALPNEIPAQLPAVEDMEVGQVYGPFKDGDSFKIYKFMALEESETKAAKARHILIKTDDRTKEEARQKANSILQQLKSGGDFAALAKENSEDASNKNRGGELGWFKEGDMVGPFNEAVMNATQKGLINNVVETSFGFHIIDIMEVPTANRYLLGLVERELSASQSTVDRVYRQVGQFAKYKNGDDFVAATDADSSVVRYQALTIAKSARNINNLTGNTARSIVLWAYNNERSVGDVSDIFEMEDKFVIAMLIQKTEEGSTNFEDVKEEVRKDYITEQKKAYILEKMAGLSGTLAERQEAFGNAAKLDAKEDLNFATNSLPGAGSAPKTVGKVFGMEEGTISSPIADETAVVVVRVSELNSAMETADYSIYRTQIQQRLQGAAPFKVSQAIEDWADVKDYRYKFF